MPETGQRRDPFRSFNFLIELDGLAQASFMECSGLGATTEVIEFRQGGDNTTVYKLPGKTTYTDITLKWGITSDKALWTWRQQIINGEVIRRNGAIVLYDLGNHQEVARWSFFNAWPTRWEGPTLNAHGNEVAVDTLVLAHEGIRREQRP